MHPEDILRSQLNERYAPYRVECPECHDVVDTVPAEGVPDQSLRGCPKCEAVFFLSEVE